MMITDLWAISITLILLVLDLVYFVKISALFKIVVFIEEL